MHFFKIEEKSQFCAGWEHWIFLVYTVDLAQLRADKQKYTALEVMGFKAERTQINIATPEFHGASANTACSSVIEGRFRQHSLNVAILPTQVASEHVNKLFK